MRFPACRSYLLAVALSLTARLATPPADFPRFWEDRWRWLQRPSHAGKETPKEKDALSRRPPPFGCPHLPALSPLPWRGGGAAGAALRKDGRCRPRTTRGRGGPRGGSAPHPQLTPFPLPPQELESPEVSQFRLAANRTPEVPFGLSSSPAVLSHYGVATNTVTLFRRVRGPSRVGWGHPRRCCGRRTRGATRGGLRLAPNPFPTGETTVPCKGLLSSSTCWFW